MWWKMPSTSGAMATGSWQKHESESLQGHLSGVDLVEAECSVRCPKLGCTVKDDSCLPGFRG